MSLLTRTSFLLLFLALQATVFTQAPVFDALQWRCIGPHRGGRTVGAVGVPQQPNVFYIGVNNGGVWKTTDYGRTWVPIFDDQPTGSIGDVVVAPSDPNVLYVASGEGLQRPDLSVGDGIYKSTDGGQTWQHTGLRDGLQIGGLSIDPANPDRVFAAVLGHPYGSNTERGVFRTLNGGKTWEKVKYIDENTGAIQVTIDPVNPNVVYADLWANRLAPWENGEWQGPGSGLWKSVDGGDSWTQLTEGLPTPAQGLGRIGFCICPSLPSRLYATVDAGELGGIYRSDDAGKSWYRTNADWRLWGRGSDFAEVKADPKNPDIVYTANVVTWKSTDGGHNWEAFRGAPGGDDYHRIWINPDNPEVILIASDQGAIITVNGGQTFSSWYNQPTAQFYHVSTDNAFPYNVYGGQQESGSVGIASRGNDGQITFREWHSVGVEEYGYVAADPLDPNIIYGGKISKYDKRTGQTQNITPEPVSLDDSRQFRFIRTQPVLFSPVDPKTLYLAGNVLFKTTTGGDSWEVISPDLTRETWEVPACVGVFSPEAEKTKYRRGVIYAVAPSQQDINTIWAGTDDGLIHLTRDGGKNWTNITPPQVTDWSKVSQLDAGHFDNNTCYAAINRIRLDDLRPLILRTHDGGQTWQEITTGLPDNDPINTVREDPVRKGLLFAGGERAVYVSFDDGDHWQSLRQNMPATSIRDLVIKDDDIVVGTHGRSFWILDNITPLRQYQAGSTKTLYTPQSAWRVRWNMNPDTPLPQEEPAGQNPPDGAMIDYYLAENAREILLQILDSEGQLIRNYRPDDPAPGVSGQNFPPYWVRPHLALSGEKGAHRFCWDMCYDPLPDVGARFPISAIYENTAPRATAPFVMPGIYTVRLTVDGKIFEEPLEIKMDPRVTTSTEELQRQHDLSLVCYESRQVLSANIREIVAHQDKIGKAIPKAKGKLAADFQSANAQFSAIVQDMRGLQNKFARLFGMLQESDMPVPSQVILSVEALDKESMRLQAAYREFIFSNEKLLK
ncbi:MAG: glycoside hydrolase [Saprospirales bacterium]|nr:glycoside hydrolase [Saprospirales bacterium]